MKAKKDKQNKKVFFASRWVIEKRNEMKFKTAEWKNQEENFANLPDNKKQCMNKSDWRQKVCLSKQKERQLIYDERKTVEECAFMA